MGREVKYMNEAEDTMNDCAFPRANRYNQTCWRLLQQLPTFII